MALMWRPWLTDNIHIHIPPRTDKLNWLMIMFAKLTSKVISLSV